MHKQWFLDVVKWKMQMQSSIDSMLLLFKKKEKVRKHAYYLFLHFKKAYPLRTGKLAENEVDYLQSVEGTEAEELQKGVTVLWVFANFGCLEAYSSC